MDTAPSEDGLIDVVKTVHWTRECKGIDENEYASIYGVMPCQAPDPMAYTPYNELTFDQVCGWLEANLDMNALDAELDAKIEMQKNPPIIQLPFPWID